MDRDAVIRVLDAVCGAIEVCGYRPPRLLETAAGKIMAMQPPAKYEIESIGGNCPVQADGTIDGHKFYFRARGDRLQMHVHRFDVFADDAWFFEQRYRESPDAGYISNDLALAWIKFALVEWAESKTRLDTPSP